MTRLPLVIVLVLAAGCGTEASRPHAIRVMTFNVEDVRTDDLLRPGHPRLLRAAALVSRLAPDIVLINEVAYDEPGVPGYRAADGPGSNGRRLAEWIASGDGPRYVAFQAPSNTGRASGHDLNRNGVAVTDWPPPPSAADDGTPAAQTADGRAFGDDSWGFGTFPGQYAMALLVRSDHDILHDSVRTFRTFPWSRLPDALRPVVPDSGEPWYGESVWARFPVSSKSHWDVPVRIAGGRTIHVLASHPTPAAFDGPERRNRLRNHDEIRFWAGYLDDAAWIVDDDGRTGGLDPGRSFVILGDLNADPDEGNAIDDPVGTWLLGHPRVNGAYVPRADSAGRAAFPGLDDDDTARWGLRVDYVLPSSDFEIRSGRVVRPADPAAPAVSDHFAVYLDLSFPDDPQ